eukprot:350554-Chlamydomonas_euryale.AAC.3
MQKPAHDEGIRSKGFDHKMAVSPTNVGATFRKVPKALALTDILRQKQERGCILKSQCSAYGNGHWSRPCCAALPVK